MRRFPRLLRTPRHFLPLSYGLLEASSDCLKTPHGCLKTPTDCLEVPNDLLEPSNGCLGVPADCLEAPNGLLEAVQDRVESLYLHLKGGKGCVEDGVSGGKALPDQAVRDIMGL
jgi:hypothetical protein